MKDQIFKNILYNVKVYDSALFFAVCRLTEALMLIKMTSLLEDSWSGLAGEMRVKLEPYKPR